MTRNPLDIRADFDRRAREYSTPYVPHRKQSEIPITEPAPAAPHCPGCSKPRKPDYDMVDATGKRTWNNREATGRVFSGWKGYGAFCTMRCATDYANDVFEKTRIRRRPGGGL